MEPKEVTKCINERFNSLFEKTGRRGRYVCKPNVCCVCDELLHSKTLSAIKFKTLKDAGYLLGRTNGVDYHSGCAAYRYDGTRFDSTIEWDKMFLSPGTREHKSDNGEITGLLSCVQCRTSLEKHAMPINAIANGFYFGLPPDCLTDLTEIERAFLSPVKTYGYCFSFTGGCQKELKGSLSYYKVSIEGIARTAAHFETLGMTDNIVILLYGKMTRGQKERALAKNKIRTANILAAISWLCDNNTEWKNAGIDMANIANRLRNPILIDNSHTDEGESDTNIESRESIQIFFPDGTVDLSTGGQDSIDDFKLLILEASKNGYNMQLQADLLRESCSDYKDNNLVNACLIQFPYGSGGLHEHRLTKTGQTGTMDIETYATHLSKLARPHFHEELFVLILYNMKMKMKMVKGASWRVRQNTTATLLATELNEEDMENAVKNRRSGNSGYGAGDQFLSAIDAIARGVAHTNEAAKRARRTVECLQHHFGMPTHFLTVTPDDDNSILVQVYSQADIDINNGRVDSMDQAELGENANERKKLRIKYPGIAAMVFEHMLDIIIDVVIGWDSTTNKGKQGLMGVPRAFTATVEEQGRRSLHGHFQIWVRKTQKKRALMYSECERISKRAKRYITDETDRMMSTKFAFKKSDVVEGRKWLFPHECQTRPNARRHPIVIGLTKPQNLRDLRYLEGNSESGLMFATCPHCTKSWTYEEFSDQYIRWNVRDAGVIADGDGCDVTRRMKAKAVEYQSRKDMLHIPSYVIEAGYNTHKHTQSCFKRALDNINKGKTVRQKKLARKNLLECECRYRLPAMPMPETRVEPACDEMVNWYDCTGNHKKRQILELNVKRGAFDVFQNQSCPAIGESKFTCNTNINMIFDGCTGQYVTKYCTKNTQKDDRAEFDRVMEQKDKILTKIPNHNGERTEATRRLLLASFAHQKANVIGAPMSAYLTRNDERFIFSHQTSWVPLRDLTSLLNNRGVSGSSIIYNGKTPFYTCAALHYLCRPLELENVCAFDFYANFDVVRSTNTNRDQLMSFSNTEHFSHASYQTSGNYWLQGVRRRDRPRLPKIFQHDFPDTAVFGGDMFDEETTVKPEMEKYAGLALTLFLPFRCLEDLETNGSYVSRMRCNKEQILERCDFLNNIQDAKSNCFRILRVKDSLQRVTQPMVTKSQDETYEDWLADMDIDVEQTDTSQGEALDELIDELNRELTSGTEQQTAGSRIPSVMQIRQIKDKGDKHCGYSHLCSMNRPETSNNCVRIAGTSMVAETGADMLVSVETDGISTEKVKVYRTDLVKIIVERIDRVTRSFRDITGVTDDVVVLEASGSVRSIVDWAVKARLDRQQRRAFEMITGHFILTFMSEAIDDLPGTNRRDRRGYYKHESHILKLVEKRRRDSQQLICLLHGPGGSGKTTVIDLIMEYAKEFCKFVDGVEFDKRTIVVTALTGVAATILRGETTHGAVYLNNKTDLRAEHIELWTNTRLLIVDEVSFASKETFAKMDKNLRKLMNRSDEMYGGLSIIFSGDFRQLEPVGRHQLPVYKDPCVEFNGSVNCYLELEGMHRYKKDPAWGRLLMRFRSGLATKKDIESINTRVFSPDEELPRDIRYATYRNKERDAINAAIFEKRCVEMDSAGLPLIDTMMILSDSLKVKNGKNVYTDLTNCKTFWENCGESDLERTMYESRMDPVLRLYVGCRVMLPDNTDVKSGLANGTQARVVGITLKSDATPMEVMINDKIKVRSVFASQVERVELEHVNDRVQPRRFSIKPREHTFTASMLKPLSLRTHERDRDDIRMKAIQVPMIINNATTGHKLQGSGVDVLFVHGWVDVANWVYVMLSRLRTMRGLHLREALDTDVSKYKVNDKLQTMIATMKTRLSPSMWSDEDYHHKFGV